MVCGIGVKPDYSGLLRAEYVGMLWAITSITIYVLSKMGWGKTYLEWMGFILQYYNDYNVGR